MKWKPFSAQGKVWVMRRPLAATLALAASLALAACGDDGDAGQAGGSASPGAGPRVVAGFYPLEFLARRVAGPQAQVTSLAQPGVEAHDLELTPQQVAGLGSADLVLLLKGFQPAADDSAAQEAPDRTLDLSTVEPLLQGYVPLEEGELHEDEKGADPHVWLDARRYANLAQAVADALAERDPARAETYRTNAGLLRQQLQTLHEEYAAGLATCARRDLVTSHNAFGYLARAHSLQQLAVAGLTPEEDPSPARLAEVTRLAKDRKVTTIFFEEAASAKVAQTLASEVGAKAAVLSALESAPEQGDYFTVMRANLATLRAALSCS